MFKKIMKKIKYWRFTYFYNKTQRMLRKYLPVKETELAIVGRKKDGEVYIIPLPGLTIIELTGIFNKVLEKEIERRSNGL